MEHAGWLFWVKATNLLVVKNGVFCIKENSGITELFDNKFRGSDGRNDDDDKKTSLIKSKFKAAGVHLGISSIVFLILSYFIIFQWYPFPYFTADGGWQGIRVVALIDLVLGPLLTLIIFNHHKSRREIRFDLGTIALAQVCVLAWGIYTVYDERPAAVIHWDGELYTMPSKSFKVQGVSLNELKQFSDQKPPLIHAYRPADPELLHEILRLSTEESLAPIEQLHLYRSFKESRDVVFMYQLNIDEIILYNDTMKAELNIFLAESGSEKDEFVYMPLNARYHNVILIFSKEGDVKGSLNAPYKN